MAPSMALLIQKNRRREVAQPWARQSRSLLLTSTVLDDDGHETLTLTHDRSLYTFARAIHRGHETTPPAQSPTSSALDWYPDPSLPSSGPPIVAHPNAVEEMLRWIPPSH